MKLFQNLFKAKWKNKDPEIRKNALLALSPSNNQEIFLEVANTDDSSEIRVLATKRLTDLSQLEDISQKNSDDKVRILASKMLSQIYSGEIESTLNISELPAKIDKIVDQKLLEYIAQNGINSDIRRSAIRLINRESLLGNLTINETDPNLRMLAAEKIQQKSTLERVYKSIKTRDKTISTLIKSKLDAIVDAEQEPIRRTEQQKQICLQLENLGSKGLWERDKLQFDNLLKQWSEIGQYESDYVARFDKAKQNFENAYSAYLKRHEDRLKQEEALLPVKQQKQEMISQLHALLSKLANLSEADNTSEIESEYMEISKSWDTSTKLPKELEEEFSTQYTDAHNNLKNKLRQLKQSRDQAITLELLQDELEKLIAKPAKLTPKVIEQIERRINQSASIVGNDYTNKLKSNVKSLLQKAQELIKNRQAEVQEQLKKLESELGVMDAKCNQGILKEALAARKNVQSILSRLENLGYRKLNEYKQRASAISSKINEMADWRSWANTPQKEELCLRVEALIGSQEDPKEIAFLINQAKNEWKNMGPAERDSSQQLWERFQTACETAFEPCKSYFKEESKQKKENYQKRLEFLDNLEKFIETADWNIVDWKKVEALHKHSRDDWKNLGQTDASKRKELNKRFYASIEEIRTELSKEWARNKEKKEQILAKANELAGLEDLEAAINSTKELQKQWKTAGRIPQSQERALWAAFRKACDAVFERRDKLKQEEKDKLNEQAKEKEKICKEIETLASLPVKELFAQQGQFEKLLEDFRNCGETTKGDENRLGKLVSNAIQLYELKMESASRLEAINQLQQLKDCALAIEAIEQAIESNKSPLEVSEAVEKASQLIQEADTLKNTSWLKHIENRLNDLIKIASSQNFQEMLQNKFISAKNDKHLATIQLEILANVDTPTEFANDRLSIQTQRLNDKLKHHEEESTWEAFLEKESKWWLTGPISKSDLENFISRRNKAIENLKQEFVEELKNYN